MISTIGAVLCFLGFALNVACFCLLVNQEWRRKKAREEQDRRNKWMAEQRMEVAQIIKERQARPTRQGQTTSLRKDSQ